MAHSKYFAQHIKEAKRRGLSCGVGKSAQIRKAADLTDEKLCKKWLNSADYSEALLFWQEIQNRDDPHLGEFCRSFRGSIDNGSPSGEEERVRQSATSSNPATKYEKAPNHVVCLAIQKSWVDNVNMRPKPNSVVSIAG